tara:strand:- start:1365 stop:1613 length:249 start_codon:yes stop_codon:yes gene_type:complete
MRKKIYLTKNQIIYNDSNTMSRSIEIRPGIFSLSSGSEIISISLLYNNGVIAFGNAPPKPKARTAKKNRPLVLNDVGSIVFL